MQGCFRQGAQGAVVLYFHNDEVRFEYAEARVHHLKKSPGLALPNKVAIIFGSQVS